MTDDRQPATTRARLPASLRLHPRLVLAAFLVALGMLPVGIVLAGAGVLVLDVAGGAADDTSLVVAVAGFLVADFWGGGLVAALTRARAPQVAIAWGAARLVVLLLVALVVERMSTVVPVQLVLAVPAAFAGARVSRKQAALRRQVLVEEHHRTGHAAP